jgi:ketosteroid isomerase-like protein
MAEDSRTAANRAVVERYARAWEAGDLAALRACYHSAFTLHYFGDHPLAGDHVGLATALATLAEVSRRTRRKLVRIVDVMAGPERAVVIAREAFERDGVVIELERVLVYRIQDDLLAECWVYDGDQALVDGFLGASG